MTYPRWESKPLECWQKAKEIRRNYEESAAKAKDKGTLLVQGRDITIIYPTRYSSRRLGMTAAPLDSIVQAIRDRDYIPSLHYWEEPAKDVTRLSSNAIIESIGNDEPEIIESYDRNPRGASCLLPGVNGQGRQIHSRSPHVI